MHISREVVQPTAQFKILQLTSLLQQPLLRNLTATEIVAFLLLKRL